MSPSAPNNDGPKGSGSEYPQANPGTTSSCQAPPFVSLTNQLRPVPDPSVVSNPRVIGDWTVPKVLATVPTGAPEENSASPVPYFHMLERLKTTKREGWRRFGIAHGESISDHMYRMAMISMFVPPGLKDRIDQNKCIKMCLIHDMAESLVGDITPVDGVAKPEKSRREAETMDYLTKNLMSKVWGGKGAVNGEEIRAIWQEYEDSQTLDSHYVHDIDKIELLLQMIEYEKRGEGKLDLTEFTYVATKMALDETKEWAAEVMKEREEYWRSAGHDNWLSGRPTAPDSHIKAQDEYYAGAGGAS